LKRAVVADAAPRASWEFDSKEVLVHWNLKCLGVFIRCQPLALHRRQYASGRTKSHLARQIQHQESRISSPKRYLFTTNFPRSNTNPVGCNRYTWRLRRVQKAYAYRHNTNQCPTQIRRTSTNQSCPMIHHPCPWQPEHAVRRTKHPQTWELHTKQKCSLGSFKHRTHVLLVR